MQLPRDSSSSLECFTLARSKTSAWDIGVSDERVVEPASICSIYRRVYWSTMVVLMNGFAVIFLGFASFGLLHAKHDKLMPWQWWAILEFRLGYILTNRFLYKANAPHRPDDTNPCHSFLVWLHQIHVLCFLRPPTNVTSAWLLYVIGPSSQIRRPPLTSYPRRSVDKLCNGLRVTRRVSRISTGRKSSE